MIQVNDYYKKTNLTELHTRLTPAEAKIATKAGNIGVLEIAQPFSVTGEESDAVALTSTPTADMSVSVIAPGLGQVTLNSAAYLFHPVNGVNAVYVTF